MRTHFWRGARMALSGLTTLNPTSCWEQSDSMKKMSTTRSKIWLYQDAGIFWPQLLMTTQSNFMTLVSSSSESIQSKSRRKIWPRSQKESRCKMTILRKTLRTCRTAVTRCRRSRNQKRQKRRRVRRWQWRKERVRWKSTANVNFSKDSDVIYVVSGSLVI